MSVATWKPTCDSPLRMLIIVADGIPDELTRVVEFLNEQMPGI